MSKRGGKQERRGPAEAKEQVFARILGRLASSGAVEDGDSEPPSLFLRRDDAGGGASPAAGEALQPGRVVGDFRLGSLLGRGGMGQVWEAEQLSIGGRKVALKFLSSERVTPRQSEYFQREARAGGRLNHPGLVAVHACGEDGGLGWIAMELVEGAWTLRDSIEDLARQPEVPAGYDREVARFVAEIAEAMQAAHDAGVIHRDLKPQNVLVTPDNHAKVSDFGLARIIDESALSLTGEVAGTYFYMSPEQVTGKRIDIDHRTDVFSLGVILYEMLALRRPFQGDTTHQIAMQIVMKDPPVLRSIRSRIPPELVVIAGRALEKDRDRRFVTMGELAADLRRFLAHEPIQALPPSARERALKWVRRNPTKSAIGSVAGVAFLVILVLLVANMRANRSLAQANVDLGKKTAEAEAEALSVKRLSALQDLEDLIAEADGLWPAHPERIEELRGWIARAQALIDGLPVHRAQRAELRASALPRTEEERSREREGHPEFERLVSLEAEIGARRRALARRRDGVALEPVEVDWSRFPEETGSLHAVARTMVDPERIEFGNERLGLELALGTLERASPEWRASALRTLGGAYFALGMDEEALDARYAAVEAAPEDRAAEFAAGMARFEEEVAAAASVEGLLAAEEEVARLEAEHRALDARIDERRDWRFPPELAEARWWNNQLTKLIAELEALADPETGSLSAEPGAVSPEHGWSMPRRLAFAERLREGLAPQGDLGARWERDLEAIRAAYPNLPFRPHAGLAPIGPDPRSGLWEFWHVATGEEPRRGADGELVMTEASGVVLVLLPGGTFWMGAQGRSESGRSFDPQAQGNEAPPHEVTLSAFFMSKFELTQAQWQRIAGANPSRYRTAPEAPTLLHPVERVSWLNCATWLPRAGLELPSEAQWEYAARAGTDTPWWTGAERESLRQAKAVNLADRAAARDGGTWLQIADWPELDDGFAAHAPIGTYAPNAFGLHEVHGNLWEWCLDVYDAGFYGRSPARDPVAHRGAAHSRVLRGGGFKNTATTARSANRSNNRESNDDIAIGVRPARAVQP